MASNMHFEIKNNQLVDIGSTNGTFLNGKIIEINKFYNLTDNDIVTVGEIVFKIEKVIVKSKPKNDVFNFAKFPTKFNNFPNSSTIPNNSSTNRARSDIKRNSDTEIKGIIEFMEEEFKKIIGHDVIKQQLKSFYKKVQLDQIRMKLDGNVENNNKGILYHMIFAGPPGTGKTSMANLVAKIFCKMGLTQNNKVIFVNNSLELVAEYLGQTPAKVDKKVAEAKGGVIFIDEAYSLIGGAGSGGHGKNGGTSSSSESCTNAFGKEAIDTIMKHLDPPTCVFIFAGYTDAMDNFLRMNDGLARRIPYRYVFESYTSEQLFEILKVMCKSKNEILHEDIIKEFLNLLNQIPLVQKNTQNGGLINNWLSFAQFERDTRINIDDAIKNPEITRLLTLIDFKQTIPKILSMK